MRLLACLLGGLGCTLVVFAQLAVDWRTSDRTTRLAVHAVVETQLAALQAEKFDDAYAVAARGIREQFSPPVFAELIRRGYRVLLEHRARVLGLVRDDGDRRAYVDVQLTDAKGERLRVRYQLVREDGGWRISGVVALPPESSRGDA